MKTSAVIREEVRKLKAKKAGNEIDIHRTNGGNTRPPRFTLDEARQIRWLYDQGDYTIRQLAAKFRCAPQTIDNVLIGRGYYSALGYREPRPQRPPLTEREKKKIRRLEWEDWEISAIAQEIKCSKGTVLGVLREFDID